MFITWGFNQNISTYIEKGVNNCFPEIERCPQCRSKTRLKRHGFYYRNAVEDGKIHRVPICRLKCPSCQKTVSLLPDFLLPYFQYTIHAVISHIKGKLMKKKEQGVRQLIDFHYKRFINQITNIEMFFRDNGWTAKSPSTLKEKAITLLEMITAFGEATFARKSNGHFRNNFMAH